MEVLVGTTADFAARNKKVVQAGGTEIGVIQYQGQYYAYANYCLHQGGPVCEGSLVGRVETVLDDEKRVVAERFSETDMHLVCPWHGYEYNLRTGECAADRSLRLKPYPVVERGDAVYVVLDD